MSKFIAITRPFDDADIIEVYEVQHNSKGPKAFQTAWDREVEAAKKANPEEWNVDQVIEALEKKHWTIKWFDNKVTVTY